MENMNDRHESGNSSSRTCEVIEMEKNREHVEQLEDLLNEHPADSGIDSDDARKEKRDDSSEKIFYELATKFASMDIKSIKNDPKFIAPWLDHIQGIKGTGMWKSGFASMDIKSIKNDPKFIAPWLDHIQGIKGTGMWKSGVFTAEGQNVNFTSFVQKDVVPLRSVFESKEERASPPLLEVLLTTSDEDDDGSVLELVIPIPSSRYFRVPTSSPLKAKRMTSKTDQPQISDLFCCLKSFK